MLNMLKGIIDVVSTLLSASKLVGPTRKIFGKKDLEKKCNAVGIIDIFQQGGNPSKNPSMMPEKLINANKIRIFQTTGNKFFNTNWECIEGAIKKNEAKVSVLIADENSDFLKDVQSLEVSEEGNTGRISNEEIQTEIKVVRDIIDKINERLSTKFVGREVKVRYYKTEFRLSMVLVESTSGENWGWITLTLPPAKARNSISFEITTSKEDDNIFNHCIRHFDEIWKKIGREELKRK